MDELFAVVSRKLVAASPDVESGRILHSTGLKTSGKFFAFVARGELEAPGGARRRSGGRRRRALRRQQRTA
ncbi:MAG: hypothetical protein ACRDLK_08650, partial [Gaiellaceae bacterium]